MEIFSNWMFWVVLAAIIFILAIIGYLTDGLKKAKKKQPEKEENKTNTSAAVTENVKAAEPEKTVQQSVQQKNDDWTVMPEVNTPLEEVKVDTIEEKPAEQPAAPLFDEPAATPAETVFPENNQAETLTNVTSQNSANQQVETLTEEKPADTTDIWNA